MSSAPKRIVRPLAPSPRPGGAKEEQPGVKVRSTENPRTLA
ncbi:hypothetical protein HNQ64_002978 [Prosthecobacter dejongeii]|uniref:Uncharacterized protein n=1 Tax=Prosthecobacter dejongeii TaxID=48465 RepID=A0A7W7YMJ6_9BACT|nr:hypothetical protein [Prosthecobacter dejongeii]